MGKHETIVLGECFSISNEARTNTSCVSLASLMTRRFGPLQEGRIQWLFLNRTRPGAYGIRSGGSGRQFGAELELGPLEQCTRVFRGGGGGLLGKTRQWRGRNWAKPDLR